MLDNLDAAQKAEIATNVVKELDDVTYLKDGQAVLSLYALQSVVVIDPRLAMAFAHVLARIYCPNDRKLSDAEQEVAAEHALSDLALVSKVINEKARN